VGRPARVGDRDLRVENFGGVNVGGGDALAKAGNFANFLEVKGLARDIAINTDAGRVVTTILLTSETVAEDIANLLAGLSGRRKGG